MELENVNSYGEIELYSDVCHIIEGSRQRLETTINAEICLMHWQIGKRIKEDEIVYAVRTQLTCTHLRSLMLEDSSIKVAQYYTQLPDKNLLREKLHRAIAIAREHYQNKG